MPFTFAHPAIIIPFSEIKRASMSALVIGSITPDFEYFIRMKLTGRYSHSIEGIFLLDLPVGIIIALVFHLLVKAPLIDNLPFYFKGRLKALRQSDFIQYISKDYFYFLGCLLIGIVSHLFWDSFTHANEYFVHRIDFLQRPFSFLNFPAMPVHRYLQHASTIIGFIVIGFVFHKMPVQEQPKSTSYRFWVFVILLAVTAFLIRWSLGFEYFGDVVATAISALCIGLIGSSIMMRVFNG
jgi:hypothetical protein